MPERLAATSPHQPVNEVVGSGPFRFLSNEHVSGAKAAFARFAFPAVRLNGRCRIRKRSIAAHD
jgi:hypothetical protein